MTRALIIALLATTAHADERTWDGTAASGFRDSYVSLGDPTVPDAVATVTFDNQPLHSANDVFQLSHGDITVTVTFEWNINESNNERITVDAPDGYAAVPRYIDVAEGEIGEIQIIEWAGI